MGLKGNIRFKGKKCICGSEVFGSIERYCIKMIRKRYGAIRKTCPQTYVCKECGRRYMEKRYKRKREWILIHEEEKGLRFEVIEVIPIGE